MSGNSQRLESAQRDVVETREYIADTSAELRHVVAQRAAAVDPRTYIREFPWIALGLAVGAGVAIAMTGAERQAATAAADGARKLGGALVDGANAAADAVMHQFTHDGTEPQTAGSDDSEGVRGRVRGAIDGLHIFMFGGVARTAAWLEAALRR